MPDTDTKEQRSLLDLDVRRQLVAYLAELTGRVRLEIARKEDVAAKSGWMRFWTWLRDNHTGVSALVTSLSLVVGGIWAITQFRAESREKREQESKQLQVQRNSIIAQYATQLGDPSLRNSAVYGLAVLAREDALPLLILQLQDSVQKTEAKRKLAEKSRQFDDSADADFRRAITQAILLIGEPALQPIVQLNRESRGASRRRGLDQGEVTLLKASQTILERLLPRTLVKGSPPLDLSGVYLQKAQFERVSWHRVDLSDTHMIEVNFCRSQMPFVHLEGSRLDGVMLMGADLQEARLNAAYLSSADLRDTLLVRADLTYARLEDAEMERANLRGAKLNRAYLGGANLRSASLREAVLSDAFLLRADLEDADLSGADLGRAVLFNSWNDQPGPHFSGEGAFVRGARLTNARNVSDPQRRYFCRWAALEVPGGCADTPQTPIPANLSRHRRFGGGFSCGEGGEI